MGLFVSEEEGSRRERERMGNDARPDGANRWVKSITHTNIIYDIEIDNTHLNIDETAIKLRNAIDFCKNPTAFKRTCDLLKLD